jgi:hypothetical protein
MMDDEKKYSWTYKPGWPASGSAVPGTMNCCESDTSTCHVTKLWEAAELTAFHDSELRQATSEINAILEEITNGNKDTQRELSFIQFKGRHFLVWTTPGIVGPDSDDQTIRKMLRLKAT